MRDNSPFTFSFLNLEKAVLRGGSEEANNFASKRRHLSGSGDWDKKCVNVCLPTVTVSVRCTTWGNPPMLFICLSLMGLDLATFLLKPKISDNVI